MGRGRCCFEKKNSRPKQKTKNQQQLTQLTQKLYFFDLFFKTKKPTKNQQKSIIFMISKKTHLGLNKRKKGKKVDHTPNLGM